jgi:hypothetical protein
MVYKKKKYLKLKRRIEREKKKRRKEGLNDSFERCFYITKKGKTKIGKD